MTRIVHSPSLRMQLPHVLEIDASAWLRQVEPTDAFERVDHSITRYITWTAMAVRSPGRKAVDVLKEYCIGSFNGRYMLIENGKQAGYVGLARGIKDNMTLDSEENVASIAYYVLPHARGNHLASRAVNAITQLSLPISEWVLTIADKNTASIRVAETCGFLATDAYVADEVLHLQERVFRKQGIQ